MDQNKMTKSNYESFIIDNIKIFYGKLGLKYKPKATLGEWISHYFNFRLRYIDPLPREVFVSKELATTLAVHDKVSSIFDIIGLLKNGQDVNRYQSIRLMDTDYDDNLFNDWGLHHLHLSNQPHKTSGYFYNRTDDLLFLRIVDESVYLINIFPHGSFSKKELIAIIQRNWEYLLPENGHVFYPDWTEDEIRDLRRKGYLTGVNVNGKGYLLLGHGYASSGDNMMAGRMSDKMLRWIYDNSEIGKLDPDLFKINILKQLYLI